ncbi:serine O-acetyltransferase [Rheinheimera pacifica]|uniref:Serine acetyltransferase n=1 Tax=Rheinheimera pacifica TaxID=173990 RepID=A0A1H6MMU9_9GAMM|nr:serine O-acetyltransferase [Rheinheimera pacifica]SEH98972.1 serine O-acetyltransferase [Rheinheimera pacifica]
MLKDDLLRTYELVDGGRLKKVLGCYRTPGCHAVVTYRFGQWLSQKNIFTRILLEPFYLLQYHRMRSKWGIEIPRAADIGPGLYIGHNGGIVISSQVKAGKNLSISQGVTIGVSGKGIKRGVPVIGDNVYIAPGAKVFGKIFVGSNVSIGANAVVNQDVPDNSVAVISPGIVIFKKNPS